MTSPCWLAAAACANVANGFPNVPLPPAGRALSTKYTARAAAGAATSKAHASAADVLQRPRMLENLTIDDFLPLVGSSFWLYSGEHKVEMRLEKAAPVMESQAARLKRTAFALHFLAPLLVPQG